MVYADKSTFPPLVIVISPEPSKLFPLIVFIDVPLTNIFCLFFKSFCKVVILFALVVSAVVALVVSVVIASELVFSAAFALVISLVILVAFVEILALTDVSS